MVAIAIIPLIAGATVQPQSMVRLVQPALSRFDLQTATLVFDVGAGKPLVELAALVHVGEEHYYHSFRRSLDGSQRVVLCELMTSAANVDRDGDVLVLRKAVGPSAAQRSAARAVALVGQLEALAYGEDPSLRRIADVPLEELEERAGTVRPPTVLGELASTIARGAIRGAGAGALRMRAGPALWQQLFRAGVWLVPCPEVGLLCLDFSWSRTPPTLSPLLTVIARALATGQFALARRCALAQVLLSSGGDGGGAAGRDAFGEAAGGGAGARLSDRMRLRNAAALAALERAVATPGCRLVTMVYGPAHMEGPQGLVAGVRARWPAARLVDVEWRTAFALDPRQEHGSPAGRDDALLAATITGAALAASAVDWWVTVEDVITAPVLDGASSAAAVDVVVAVAGYVIRHGAIMYALSQFALDWSGRTMDLDSR